MARYEDTFPSNARRPVGAAASQLGSGAPSSGISGRTLGMPGRPVPGGQANAPADDFVPAEFWINVGIWNGGQNQQGETIGFISLPGRGIALDQLKLPKSNSNSPLQQAQLGLWHDVMEVVGKLEPGEVIMVPEQPAHGEMCMQFRRVGQESRVNEAENPFRVKAFA